MEVFILAIVVMVLAVACAVLATSVPLLWWKAFRLQSQIDVLDAALTALIEAAGIKKEVK